MNLIWPKIVYYIKRGRIYSLIFYLIDVLYIYNFIYFFVVIKIRPWNIYLYSHPLQDICFSVCHHQNEHFVLVEHLMNSKLSSSIRIYGDFIHPLNKRINYNIWNRCVRVYIVKHVLQNWNFHIYCVYKYMLENLYEEVILGRRKWNTLKLISLIML